MASSYVHTIQHMGELMDYLECAGFTINLKKNRPWPVCQAIFLGASPGQRVREGSPFPGEMGQSGVIAGTIPQGGARDLPHSQAVELVVCSAPGSPIGSVELKQSWFSHVYAVYGSHDTQFNMVIVTIPTEVALDLTHWKQAASDNSECPWVYKALWSPYSRMRATQGGVPSLDTKRSIMSGIAADTSATGRQRRIGWLPGNSLLY